MPEESILIVGATRASSEADAALASESWSVTIVEGLAEAIPEIDSRRHQVVILDTDAIPEPPWQALEILRERDPQATVLLLVSSETPWSSFSSYRQRPAGLVLKPLDRAALLMAVDSAVVYRRLLEENRTLKRQLGSAVSLGDWVGCTPESIEIRKSIATAALANGNVLLLGEDGSGRRLAAELLHRHGRNPGATFLPVDLMSLPAGEIRRLFDEVLEAADTGRGAYVHGARPGTLYLAELTALTPEDQRSLAQKLLRPLPFRVMASAHPSLVDAVRQNRFDEETFRAVSKVRIQIPPLAVPPSRYPAPHRPFPEALLRAVPAQVSGDSFDLDRELLELRLAGKRRRAGDDDRARGRHRLGGEIRRYDPSRAFLLPSFAHRSRGGPTRRTSPSASSSPTSRSESSCRRSSGSTVARSGPRRSCA